MEVVARTTWSRRSNTNCHHRERNLTMQSLFFSQRNDCSVLYYMHFKYISTYLNNCIKHNQLEYMHLGLAVSDPVISFSGDDRAQSTDDFPISGHVDVLSDYIRKLYLICLFIHSHCNHVINIFIKFVKITYLRLF